VEGRKAKDSLLFLKLPSTESCLLVFTSDVQTQKGRGFWPRPLAQLG
jgi:hypothetical protein